MEPGVPGNRDDTEAIRLALRGDHDAWQRLHEKYRLHVYRLAYRVTFNEDDAMDAAQETFIKIATQLHRFNARGSFRAWLTTIAIREATTICRKRATTPRPIPQEALFLMLESSAAEASAETQQEQIDRNRRLEQVQSAAEQLSPQQRAILLMGVTNDIGPAQIAKELNLPANQVRSQWSRAVAKLKSLLNPTAMEAAANTEIRTRNNQ